MKTSRLIVLGLSGLALVAGLAGSVVGVLWNYAMSSMFIWRTR